VTEVAEIQGALEGAKARAAVLEAELAGLAPLPQRDGWTERRSRLESANGGRSCGGPRSEPGRFSASFCRTGCD